MTTACKPLVRAALDSNTGTAPGVVVERTEEVA